jgi:soluble lytic murein transglycosylase-like protein
LPAYLVYITAYRARTGKAQPSLGSAALRPQDQLEIARLMVGTKGVWGVTDSPWTDVVMGTSDAVIKPNLAFLQDQAAKAVLQEQKKAATPPPAPTPAPAQTVKQQAEAVRTAPSIDRQTATASSPDAETKPPVQGTVAGVATTTTATGLVLASGDMSDGRNANAFVRLGRNVKLDGMNSQMKTQLMGLIEEYGNLTGKSTTINDGVRTYEEQAALKAKYGDRAAAPGTSMHEYGLAVDINQTTLNEMDKLGLLRKYGFVRPVGQEPWHMEPIGTQTNLDLYKNDSGAAAQAVLSGAGKGGGGWGVMREAVASSRNLNLAKSILDASVAESDPKQLSGNQLAGSFTAPLTQPAVSFANRTKMGTSDAPAAVTSIKAAAGHADTSQKAQIGEARTALASANDAEFQVKKPSAPLNPLTGGPGDPATQVPEPTGSGLAGVKDTILAAAKLVGTDGNLMLQTAAVESDFNPNASPGNTSAKGLWQDTDATWADLIKKYGARYGYTLQNTSPTDVKAAAILNAHFLKDNLEALGRQSTRPLSAADAYALQLLGRSGGEKFLAALAKTPEAIAAELFPSAAKKNPNLFYRGGQPLSVADVFANMAQVIRKKSQAYGLDSGPIDVASSAAQRSSSQGALIGVQPSVSPSVSVVPLSTRGRPSSMAPAIIGAGTTPMMQPAGSYLPPAYTAPARAMPQPQHVLDSKALSKSEDLLGKQLEVQLSIKDVLIDIQATLQANQQSGGASAPEPASTKPQTYVPPQGRVSMRRQRYGNEG